MRFLLAILGLGFMAPPSRSECLTYCVPGDPGPEETAKGVRIFSSRCRAYGYRGIHTAITRLEGVTYVQVTCETGITPAMKRVLGAFAELSGSSVEIRFPYSLCEVEGEQYGWEPDPAEDRAPEGTGWFRPWKSETAPVLLRNTPLVAKADLLQTVIRDGSGKDHVIWELSKLKTRELQKADRSGNLGVPYLIMDGFVLDSLALTTRTRNEDGEAVPMPRASFSPNSRFIRELLLKPLPFAFLPCEAPGCKAAKD
jgi:hypothetical protein